MHVIWRALTTFVRLVVARWHSIVTRRRFKGSVIRGAGSQSGRDQRPRRGRQLNDAIRQRDRNRQANRTVSRVRDAEVLRNLSVLRGGAQLRRGRIVGGLRHNIVPPLDDRAS